MATGVVSQVFIDTNILVYATMSQSPFHAQAQAALQTLNSNSDELWISRQIIREYLAVLSRAQASSGAVSPADLIREVESFLKQYAIAEDGPDVTAKLLDLLLLIDTGGKQVHDANIVATMLVHGIGTLLTHNVSDFTRFSSLITVVPL
ncbi:MAG TPA: PIN domain-containing protein [Chloroflexia bacterium]|nr:PIN domain-containing protein [Chloroflexia bacterium]